MKNSIPGPDYITRDDVGRLTDKESVFNNNSKNSKMVAYLHATIHAKLDNVTR